MKCPKCGREVSVLINVQSGYKRWSMDDGGNYEEKEWSTDGNVNFWECPECSMCLAYSEDEALDLLKGSPETGEDKATEGGE